MEIPWNNFEEKGITLYQPHFHGVYGLRSLPDDVWEFIDPSDPNVEPYLAFSAYLAVENSLDRADWGMIAHITNHTIIIFLNNNDQYWCHPNAKLTISDRYILEYEMEEKLYGVT